MAGPTYVDTAAIAARYGVHSETIRRRFRRGDIPGVKVGGSLRFDPDAVDAAIRGDDAPEVGLADAVLDRVAALVVAEIARRHP